MSISLPEDDVEFLDAYALTHGMPSRSAVLQRAVELLRTPVLAAAYEQAWAEWSAAGDADAWESTTADGLS